MFMVATQAKVKYIFSLQGSLFGGSFHRFPKPSKLMRLLSIFTTANTSSLLLVTESPKATSQFQSVVVLAVNLVLRSESYC